MSTFFYENRSDLSHSDTKTIENLQSESEFILAETVI